MDQKHLVLALAVSYLILDTVAPPPLFLGRKMEALVNSSFGVGKGKGIRKRKPKRYVSIDVWSSLMEKGNVRVEGMIHMTVEQFLVLLKLLKEANVNDALRRTAFSMTFENKILLVFVWIVSYPTYAVLATMFGVSKSVISDLITTALPHVMSFFVQYIPNSVSSCITTSALSEDIFTVIDGTVHRIWRPSTNQFKTWNDHYQIHCISSLLLVDFDGYVVACSTNIDGFVHDATSAHYNEAFPEVLEGTLALGDTGFGGVSYVVSGLRSNQVRTASEKLFDKISRSEQVIVEHINNFIKKCASINKLSPFIHNRCHLTACVFICCGWYNWMKQEFKKFE